MNNKDKEKKVAYMERMVEHYKSLGIEQLELIKDEKRSNSDQFAYEVAIEEFKTMSPFEKEVRKTYPEVKNIFEFKFEENRLAISMDFVSGQVYPIIYKSPPLNSEEDLDLFYKECLDILSRSATHYRKSSLIA